MHGKVREDGGVHISLQAARAIVHSCSRPLPVRQRKVRPKLTLRRERGEFVLRSKVPLADWPVAFAIYIRRSE